MPDITLGHRLARELARRGNRRRYFWTAQYRELRRIDSIEELADFLDRTGYRCTRASDDIEAVADDIDAQRGSPGLIGPSKGGLVDATLGLLLFPFVLIWRSFWR